MNEDARTPAGPAAPSPSSAGLRAEALRVLRRREDELRAKGVIGLAMFGSVARDEADPTSDIDLILELDRSAALGLLDLVELKETLAEELGRSVDVAFRSRLRPWLAARIAPDLVRVF